MAPITYQPSDDIVSTYPEHGNNGQKFLPPKELAQPPHFGRRNWLVSSTFILLALVFTAMFAFGLWIAIAAALQDPLHSFATPCVPDSWFTVGTAVGSFTYDEVKIIDAAFNAICGRGSQIIFGSVCYTIFGMALLRLTERRRIPIELFTVVSLYPLQASTIPKLLRALVSNRSWSARGVAVSVWATLAVAYIISLPTLLDVMTGYIAASIPVLQLNGNEYQTFDFTNCSGSSHSYYNGSENNPNYNGSYWTFCLMFDVGGKNYTPERIVQASPSLECVPQSTYQWGISLGWAWVVIICTMIWLWGMFGLWHDGQKHSLLWRGGRRPGLFRSVLDIANTINDSLGPDTCAYSDKELTEAIRKLDPVGYEATEDGDGGHIRLNADAQGCTLLKIPDVTYRRRPSALSTHREQPPDFENTDVRFTWDGNSRV